MPTGGKKIDKATGYRSTSFNQLKHGWSSDETRYPHYLNHFGAKWKRMPKIGNIEKQIQSMTTDKDGNCWAGTVDEDLYHFNREKGSWRLVSKQSYSGKVTPQSLFLRSRVEAGGVHQQTIVVSTAGSITDGGARGFRLKYLRNGKWHTITEGWFMGGIVHPIDESLIAIRRDGRLYHQGVIGGWASYVMVDKKGRKRFKARDIAVSDGRIFALLPNRKEIFVDLDQDKGFFPCPKINGELPAGIARAPQKFGVTLLYPTSGIRFWDPTA